MKSARIILCVFIILLLSSTVFGHEEGAHFSGALGEPFRVHHAHIEDEQSFSFSFNDDFRKEEGGKERFAFESTIELAAAWNDDFNLGSEILFPFSDTGNDDNRYALGDIEIWPIKYSFLNHRERILTGVLSIGLPTGKKKHGFGENQTKLGALFFLDQSWRNWFIGANTEFEFAASGPTETEVEFAFALTYSFIEETGDGIAPSKPKQFIVPVLSLELISENVLSGEEKENDTVTIIPGVQLWNPASGLRASLGAEIPISSHRDNDFKVHLKLQTHFDW